MTTEQFLEGVYRNIERVNNYQLGMDGENGSCDCIGLIIGAIRLMGGEWKGTHGSNYAARNEIRKLDEIINTNSLSVGDIVFKAKQPGQSGYALPDKYDSHPDKKDYYHVGVVTSTAPLVITHCTSVAGGIKSDESLGQWQYYGQLIKVQSGETIYYTVQGGTLKMRVGPGTTYAVTDYIPNGAQVEYIDDAGEDWVFVRWSGKTGFCMRKYLSQSGENSAHTSDDHIVLTIPLSAAKSLHMALNKALEGGE